MSIWHETIRLDGERIDPNITQQVTAARLIRTMDGAESLELDVSDPDMDLLASGALTRKGHAPTRQQRLKEAAWDRFGDVRLTLDGVFFRLAGVTLNYDAQPWYITITFEAEAAALMRAKHAPIKQGRDKGNRVSFVKRLTDAAQIHRLDIQGSLTFQFFGPPGFGTIAKPKDEDRTKGLHPGADLTIKGAPITTEQRRNLTIALQEAEDAGATERVTLAMLVAGIGESSFIAQMNQAGSGYGGVFQGDVSAHYHYFKVSDTQKQAHYFLHGGKGFQAGGAIKLAAANPDYTPGGIAYRVEGDVSNFSSAAAAEGFYQQHANEAKKILDAWGGAGLHVRVVERFEFRAGAKDSSTGKRENYWDASGRLADERNWRRFATRNSFWFGPDAWLIQSKPSFLVNGKPKHGESRKARLSDQGVLGIAGDADVGMPIAELRLTAIAPRWTAGPGTVFEFDNMGPLTGRWLIWENRLDITRTVEVAQITLRRPAPQKIEPAPSTTTRVEDAPETGSPRDRIVRMAEKAFAKQPHYAYLQSRPMPSGLFAFPRVALPTGGTTDGILRIDCSAFVTLVYKAAGVVDPNGRRYDGFGFTGTLIANGTKTSDPQPGDLVFYRSPEHVAVYIGHGKVIEMGGTPGPRKLPVTYRSDLIGYYTYDLSDR